MNQRNRKHQILADQIMKDHPRYLMEYTTPYETIYVCSKITTSVAHYDVLMKLKDINESAFNISNRMMDDDEAYLKFVFDYISIQDFKILYCGRLTIKQRKLKKLPNHDEIKRLRPTKISKSVQIVNY